MLKIVKFVFGPFSENTYLLYDQESRESAIIDPGNIDPYEDKILESQINDNNLKLDFIILTHSHIDHLLGVSCLKKTYNSKIYAPEQDMPLMAGAAEQGRMFGISTAIPPPPDEFFEDGEQISVGSSKGIFIFTPGHTPGEHSLYFKNEKLLFTGDVLFRETIGRTDLWGGDSDILMDSIRNKILTLPEDVVVHPGHGESTTIGHEKKYNPYLKC